jgi:succinyl-diaminopimelate desuccinylase
MAPMTLEGSLGRIEACRDQMVEQMMRMIRVPAIGPLNGGDGEGKRADLVQTFLRGFDEVRRLDVVDRHDPAVMRPNILAVKKGGGEGTVWIVSHLDTVLPGDLSAWDSPPYQPELRDGRIYGLGTEDNGQAVIASICAAESIELEPGSRRSIGLAIVADEETTSAMGIEHLIKSGVFGPEDVFIVPDWGMPDGGAIEVAEKHLVWLGVIVEGRQAHGSTPDKGLNAVRIGSRLMLDVLDALQARYPDHDPLFSPPTSTFEPTKRLATVGNINTIPGRDEFYLDIRLLPRHDPEGLVSFVHKMVRQRAEETGAAISLHVEQRTISGRPSRVQGEAFQALSESVQERLGVQPEAVGVGGGTCANFFRLAGWDAYVWQKGDNVVHQPNEYCRVENLVSDAKVFATFFHKMARSE